MQTVSGTIDFHIHCSPDTKPRLYSAVEAARAARDAGMRAIVLKSHTASTADVALLCREVVPEVLTYGGLVLNKYCGGFNPYAVTECLKRDGKVIWMPTVDAANHLSRGAGAETGLTILADGIVVDEVKEILRMAADAGAVVATGHLHAREIFALGEAAGAFGAKVLVNHPQNLRLGLTTEMLRDLVSMGLVLEHCFNFVTPHLPVLKPEALIESMLASGAEQSIMATDMGQVDNFPPTEGMRVFIETARRLGVSESDITLMTKTNPARLLGLPEV